MIIQKNLLFNKTTHLWFVVMASLSGVESCGFSRPWFETVVKESRHLQKQRKIKYQVCAYNSKEKWNVGFKTSFVLYA